MVAELPKIETWNNKIIWSWISKVVTLLKDLKLFIYDASCAPLTTHNSQLTTHKEKLHLPIWKLQEKLASFFHGCINLCTCLCYNVVSTAALSSPKSSYSQQLVKRPLMRVVQQPGYLQQKWLDIQLLHATGFFFCRVSISTLIFLYVDSVTEILCKFIVACA